MKMREAFKVRACALDPRLCIFVLLLFVVLFIWIKEFAMRNATLVAFTRSLARKFRSGRKAARRSFGSQRLGSAVVAADVETLEDRTLLSAINGTVFEDANENGVQDNGENGMGGVRVFLDVNNNDTYDTAVQDGIEPDEFADLGIFNLTNVVPGVTLDVISAANTTVSGETVQIGPAAFIATTGTRHFARNNGNNLFTSSRRLSAQFDDAVSAVSIDIRVFGGNGTAGRLQAFDEFGVSVGIAATTGGLPFETLTINAGSNTISRVVAFSSNSNVSIGLDNLTFVRPEISTLSAADGSYELANLPAGTYTVRQEVPAGFEQTAPVAPDEYVLALQDNETLTGNDFGNAVLNEPPVADAGGPYTINEGDGVTLDATGSSDPDLDPLTYAWDLDNDGDFDDAVGATVSLSAVQLAALGIGDDGVFAIAVEASDGTVTDVAGSTISVNNLPPEILSVTTTADSIGGVAAGEVVSVSGQFADAGLLDTHTVAIDWGDGTTSVGSSVSGVLAGSHTYADAGIYSITVTLTDDDGGVDTFGSTAYITGVSLQGGVLRIIGTSQDDWVSVRRTWGGNLRVRGNLVDTPSHRIDFARSAVDSIEVYLGDGDDVFLASSHVHKPLLVSAGAGDDLVYGGGGRSVIIGGTGSDWLFGGSGQDILIDGTTNFDNDPAALSSVLAEWSSSNSLQDRVANLVDGSGATVGSNGSNFLTVGTNGTVHSDDSFDFLSGGHGVDWLFYEPGTDFAWRARHDLFADDLDCLLD